MLLSCTIPVRFQQAHPPGLRKVPPAARHTVRFAQTLSNLNVAASATAFAAKLWDAAKLSRNHYPQLWTCGDASIQALSHKYGASLGRKAARELRERWKKQHIPFGHTRELRTTSGK